MNESNTRSNEKDLETMHVCDCTVDDDLKEVNDTIYANKLHILFGSSLLKNSITTCLAWNNFYMSDLLENFP